MIPAFQDAFTVAALLCLVAVGLALIRGRPGGAQGDTTGLASPRRRSSPEGSAADGQPVRTTPIPAPTRRALAAARRVEDAIRFDERETAFALDRTTGRELFRETGTRNTVELSSAQVQTARGNVITHNHPDGGSFSEADIRFAAFAQVAETRLVDADWRYSMRPPSSGWNQNWHDRVLVVERDKAERAARAHLRARVLAGEMTNEDAFALLMHETWMRTANALGMTYNRTRVRR